MENHDIMQWINVVLAEINELDSEQGIKILEKCGRGCAKSHGLPEEAQKIRSEVDDKNNYELLFKMYKERVYNTPRLYKEGNVIYLEYHECGCPLVNSGEINNSFFCNCTRGYTKERFETLFGKPLKVELLQSMLKGDKICKQAITIQEDNPNVK